MITHLKHYLSHTHRERVIDKAMRKNRSPLDHLHDTLFSNILQDGIYADFPNLPRMVKKEWREAGAYRFKIITNLIHHNTHLMLRVHAGEEWIGTLSLKTFMDPDPIITLPQELKGRAEISRQIDRIFFALLTLDAEDSAARERPQAA